MVGETVKINKGQKDLLESVLSYTQALDKMFKKLMQESRDAHLRERNLWAKLGKIAKKQYPNYNPKEHLLIWNWETHSLTIGTHKQREAGLLV